ncbi:threo-3-hydroxy-L-aspartate ammonia-lyase [Propionibacteriaceae bacterium Y2011]
MPSAPDNREQPTELPTAADVTAAADRIADQAHRTPVLTSRTLDDRLGCHVFCKAENLQRMGAFKFRGALNAISRLTPDQLAAGVVTYSSGNHAQAVALAARIRGSRATIVMPHDAPAVKVAATEGYGGRVVRYDRYTEDRTAVGERMAAETGATVIPPFDHPDVIAGQGTAAKELLDEVGPLELLLAPLGGGGLLSGTALAAAEWSPGCRVYGVEPEAGNDGQQSFRSGSIVTIDTPRTIADGTQTTALGELTFAVIRRHVTDVLTVDDDELAEAMRFLAGRMKVVVEPSGALGIAALDRLDPELLAGKRVGVILSGGNVDLARLAGLLSPTPG